MHGVYSLHDTKNYTFLSCPALANNFPSEEKWQQTTLLLLLRIEPTSLKEKPATEITLSLCSLSIHFNKEVYKLPFAASAACSGFRFNEPNKSLPSPSSCDKKDSTLSSKEPTSPNCSISS